MCVYKLSFFIEKAVFSLTKKFEGRDGFNFLP